jgi:integrase
MMGSIGEDDWARPFDGLTQCDLLDQQTEYGYEQWRGRTWRAVLERAELAYQRPYDLRHSFASLLLHEGRSVIYVARQLGHGAQLTSNT